MLHDEEDVEEHREQSEAEFGRVTEDRLPVVWKVTKMNKNRSSR